MLTTGVIRRVDDLGRIVIPKDIRRQLRIEEGTPMDLFVEGDAIVLKKRYRSEQEKDGIVRRGEWENGARRDVWWCSECGFEINCDEYPTKFDNFKYCGCCGAKMEE